MPKDSYRGKSLEQLKAERDKATGFKRVNLTVEINRREREEKQRA